MDRVGVKIVSSQIGLLRIPLQTPFVTALRRVDATEDALLCLHTDTGLRGWGSAPPTQAITGDDLARILTDLQAFTPKMNNRSLDDFDMLLHALDEAGLCHSAQAAIEIALWDLRAQEAGMPLYRLLKGETATIHSFMTISLETPAKMCAQARSLLNLGCRRFKIKLGGDSGEDFARIEALWQLPGTTSMILDANQSYTTEQAKTLMAALEKAHLRPAAIEQPLDRYDLDGMKTLKQTAGIPLIADESVFDSEDARNVLEKSAADVVNIKLMKTGGLREAQKIADIASRNNAFCMIGCMLESPVSLTAAVHFALANREKMRFFDLDAAALCRYNPAQGAHFASNGTIVPGTLPGLGIESIEGIEWI